MQYFGKVLGVIIGLLSGIGFWGIIIGLIVGYIADKITNQKNTYSLNNKEYRDLFFRTIFQVMGHLTKSKGIVTNNDIKIALFFMKQMKLNKEDCIEAKQAFREGKQYNYPLRKKLKIFYSVNKWRSDLIKLFLEIQIQVACINGFIHPKEKKILYIVAEELGISINQFNYLLYFIENEKQFDNKNYQDWWYTSSNDQYKKKHFHKKNNYQFNLEDAYKILGVNTNDDISIIKRAYKKLMSKYHPDKLIAKKLPDKILEKSKEQAQIIQSAYNFIKKEKKFK